MYSTRNAIHYRGLPKVGEKIAFGFGTDRKEYEVIHIDKAEYDDNPYSMAFIDHLKANGVKAIIYYRIMVDGHLLHPSSYLLERSALTEPHYI